MFLCKGHSCIYSPAVPQVERVLLGRDQEAAAVVIQAGARRTLAYFEARRRRLEKQMLLRMVEVSGIEIEMRKGLGVGEQTARRHTSRLLPVPRRTRAYHAQPAMHFF
jgi:hypothetical protein